VAYWAQWHHPQRCHISRCCACVCGQLDAHHTAQSPSILSIAYLHVIGNHLSPHGYLFRLVLYCIITVPVLVLVPGDHLTIAHYGITCHVPRCLRCVGASRAPGFTSFALIDHIEGPLWGTCCLSSLNTIYCRLLSFSLPFMLYILNWSNDYLRWPEGFLKAQTCALGGRSLDWFEFYVRSRFRGVARS
jgi:hypothetical protein